MTPKDFPEANSTFLAPDGMPDVRPLRAFVGEGGVISCWEITDADMDIIQNTRQIWLYVMMNFQPPISLFAEMPFTPPVEFPELIEDKSDTPKS